MKRIILVCTSLCFALFFIGCQKNSESKEALRHKEKSDKDFVAFAQAIDTTAESGFKNSNVRIDSILRKVPKDYKPIYEIYIWRRFSSLAPKGKHNYNLDQIDTTGHTKFFRDFIYLKKLSRDISRSKSSSPEFLDKALNKENELKKEKSSLIYLNNELLSRMYFFLQDYSKSKQYINQWYNQHPYKYSSYVNEMYYEILFLIAHAEKDIAMMKEYEAKISFFAQKIDSREILGQAYEKKAILAGFSGDADTSIRASLKVMELIPEREIVTNLNIATAFQDKKDYKNAIKYSTIGLEKALAKDSVFADGFYNVLGSAYESKKDFPEALRNYQLSNEFKLRAADKMQLQSIAEIEQKYQAQKDITVNSLKAADQLKAKIITQQKWILASLIFLVVLSALLFLNWRKKNRLRTVKNRIVLENEKLKLEQTVLQLKLNPHFIYNTVSNLQGLISQNKSEESISYLNKFARLMRSVLEFDQEEYISIKDEVEQISDYIQLQQMRYQGAFEYQILVSDTIDQENQLLPPMLLQPFVENAIIHGFNGIEYKGNLFISLENSDGQKLKVRIEDNGRGTGLPKIRSLEKQSLSTKIIEQRLKIIYGEGNTSLTKEINDNGCKIVLILPKTSDN